MQSQCQHVCVCHWHCYARKDAHEHAATWTQTGPSVHWFPLLHMPKWTEHDGAAKPVYRERNSLELACGFYNAGINLDEIRAKERAAKQERLKADIVAAFEA